MIVSSYSNIVDKKLLCPELNSLLCIRGASTAPYIVSFLFCTSDGRTIKLSLEYSMGSGGWKWTH